MTKVITGMHGKRVRAEELLPAIFLFLVFVPLVLRGQNSDLLSASTARAMSERGPKARVVELAGIGHAPTLMHADQIALVRDFLLAA